MPERPRILALDLLESYAAERDINVRLERRRDRSGWICMLASDSRHPAVRGTGSTAREAIKNALRALGVEIPGE